ncbi:hypothetical protein JCGZ_22187 [Jatropha curcas]|uniref:Uncharacterized protein n=1 Tax=Jatropha curcas TaxID=180498 RepID=A0A067JSS0_JATCU|nr:hypothetical protein JCGZ_22187 [Jatropha curcas]
MPLISPPDCRPDCQRSESTLRIGGGIGLLHFIGRRQRLMFLLGLRVPCWVMSPSLRAWRFLWTLLWALDRPLLFLLTSGRRRHNYSWILSMPHIYQELYQRFCFARSYIARLYPEHHDMELEIGELRRHQSLQVAAISRLQMEVDRLRTRLEAEGIPLDFSENEDDEDDGSSSDDAPPPPPSSIRQATAGPS